MYWAMTPVAGNSVVLAMAARRNMVDEAGMLYPLVSIRGKVTEYKALLMDRCDFNRRPLASSHPL